MAHYLDTLRYGNGDITGGIDQFWLTGGLRISPREQIEFLVRLYRDQLPLQPRTMATVRRIMTQEQRDGLTLRAKTGWSVLPDGCNVGWWVGWVERGADVFFFASMIEGTHPGATFGPARADVGRSVLRRLGVLAPAG
ncbi:MAG: penicillin-binding transpeptidase domain-containing protein [Gemmatimonadaceae bacterium]